MSVELVEGVVHLSGPGRIEDAEPLSALLQAGRVQAGRVQAGGAYGVDLSAAGPLHAAVLQALLAFRPTVVGPPGDPFTAAWLLPLLAGAADG